MSVLFYLYSMRWLMTILGGDFLQECCVPMKLRLYSEDVIHRCVAVMFDGHSSIDECLSCIWHKVDTYFWVPHVESLLD